MLKVQKKHPLCTNILKIKVLKYVEKPPKLGEYDGKEDTDEHMQLVNDQVNYFNTDEASKCKLFALALVGPDML